jgi:NADH-quinone oxidoreductase subunit E
MIQTDIEPILTKYPAGRRDALIPLLQEVQDTCGYLSKDCVVRVGEHLKLPASKVYGVATFYNQFRFQPLGRHHIQVCRGTDCHVKGSAQTLAALQRTLKIAPGQTTRDGVCSLEVVACLGACGLAPVVAINGEFHAGATSDRVGRILKAVRKEASAK